MLRIWLRVSKAFWVASSIRGRMTSLGGSSLGWLMVLMMLKRSSVVGWKGRLFFSE